MEPFTLLDGASFPAKKLIFLGTGTSSGVPMLGCDCAVCTSNDPRNQRTRPSVLLRLTGGDVLIDTTPEMRIQLLRSRVGFVHAILYTHSHVDHLYGLDDARPFPKLLGRPVPIYCEPTVETDIRRIFSYAFSESARKLPPGGLPQLEFHPIGPGVNFSLLGEQFLPIRLEHGRFQVLGFRIGNLAYCTDVSRIPDESWPLLEGVETLILDALRYDPHPTHFNLEQALEVVERLKPARTYFTHLSHQFDHAQTESALPPGVLLAYDGMILDF